MPDVSTATAVEPALRVIVSSATHVGGRTGNEDAVLVSDVPAVGEGDARSEAGLLLAVADGMGGYQRGEVASEMALSIVKEMFDADPAGDAALLLKQAFRRANDLIFENGQGATPPAMMGTTLIVAVTHGKYATIASIGDSRVYLARAERITQITKDHSLVAEQVAQGAMTEQEARESPHRNILTQALGHRAKLDTKLPNIFEITLLPEDRLLLVTDGFFDVTPNEDLLAEILKPDPDGSAERLVTIAVERGTTDNVTAIVATLLPAREAALPVGVPSGNAFNLLPILITLVTVVAIALVILYLALN